MFEANLYYNDTSCWHCKMECKLHGTTWERRSYIHTQWNYFLGQSWSPQGGALLPLVWTSTRSDLRPLGCQSGLTQEHIECRLSVLWRSVWSPVASAPGLSTVRTGANHGFLGARPYGIASKVTMGSCERLRSSSDSPTEAALKIRRFVLHC